MNRREFIGSWLCTVPAMLGVGATAAHTTLRQDICVNGAVDVDFVRDRLVPCIQAAIEDDADSLSGRSSIEEEGICGSSCKHQVLF